MKTKPVLRFLVIMGVVYVAAKTVFKALGAVTQQQSHVDENRDFGVKVDFQPEQKQSPLESKGEYIEYDDVDQ